jgi:hypothetical protein
MMTEVYMEGYRVDITEEISALLNMAIDDIKDFSARSTTWSRTIVLPGTDNNNKLFGNIFQVGQSNTYNDSIPNVNYNFNAAKSASCIIFQDQLQTFKGVLRLLQININNGFNGRCEYEVSVFGNLAGLNVALSSALLETLDFSAYDHVYNDANIVASWDNPGGSGVYYPLIDYGTYSTNKHDWDIHTFRPALYVREYIDKIFSAAGFRWQGNLLDTPRFKSLVIPHSKKTMTVNLSDLFSAHSSSTFYGTIPVWPTRTPVRFNTTTGTGFTSNPEPDKILFTFNGTVTTNVEIRYSVVGTSTSTSGFGLGYFELFKNGETGTLLNSEYFGVGSYTLGVNIVVNVSMSPGDTLEFRISQGGGFLGTLDNVNFVTSDFNVKSTGGSTVAVPISIGDTVTMSNNIPQNIRRIDFLVAIVKLFNLYVYEDKFDETLIYITPYIDFYSKNTANSIDWTYKMNRNKVVKIKPMSELNAKIYKFKFKSDSDYYNDLYRKRYNEGYGDRIYDSQFEFTEQTKEFEITFSATPLVGYGGEEKVYPTIFKRTGSDSAPTEENTDSNIRILQTKKITGVAPWNIKNGTTVLNTLTRYGYAGHLDDPKIPSNDLNFGATKELFFILNGGNLSNNQFNIYWSGYMAETTNKDSKLVIANFYLTAKDILSLDFSKYIYVDGIAFRLNAIKDYNATKPDDCVVELLKLNTPSYAESAANNGPPDGCYLLWRDENTLDWDNGEALTYSGCQDNPGDGDTTGGSGGGVTPPPPPPTTFYINWSFNKSSSSGSMQLFLNGSLTPFLNITSNDSGSFIANAGDSIRASISANLLRTKHLFISNDVDGIMYDVSSTGATALSRTFTVDANKNYQIQGSVT